MKLPHNVKCRENSMWSYNGAEQLNAERRELLNDTTLFCIIISNDRNDKKMRSFHAVWLLSGILCEVFFKS